MKSEVDAAPVAAAPVAGNAMCSVCDEFPAVHTIDEGPGMRWELCQACFNYIKSFEQRIVRALAAGTAVTDAASKK